MSSVNNFDITDFRGTSAELAEFVTNIWSEAYAGKMPFPVWDADFFNWQFRLNTDNPSKRLLAAYSGEELAAVLLGVDFTFRTPRGIHPGAHWSWLSIAPEFRGKGLATALDAERVQREKQLGSELIVSYRYVGSKYSLAERPNEKSSTKQFLRKVGFWTRVLSPKQLAEWNVNRFEGWLTKTASPLIPIPKLKNSNSTIRAFDTTDLPDCLNLIREPSSDKPVAIHWSESELQHQLAGHPITNTMVLEQGDTISGLVNWHVLPFHGRTVRPVAVIDMICFGPNVPGSRQRALLNAAMARMVEQGAILALKLRIGDVPASLMWRTNFIPQPADSFLVFQWVNELVDMNRQSKLQILWR